MSRYGISYMGSKNSIVDELIFYILQRHYDAEYFIDVFTGGFAVADYVLKNTNKNVLANDLNKYVIALLERALKGELGDEVYEWVSREKFNDVKNNPDNYEDWYVGYVLTLWSFGNSQQAYLYGADIENIKKSVHDLIVNNIWDENVKLFYNEVPNDLKEIKYKDYKEKRLEIVSIIKQSKNRKGKLLENERVAEQEHLHSLEGLLRLSQEKHNKVMFHKKDWLDFINGLPKEVLENSVIYCDPPYENTAEYMIDGFDHDKFWQWFRETPYSVYVSGYEAPKDIKPLNFEYKRSLLTVGSGDTKVENLYFNGKGKYTPTMEDLLFNE